MKSELKCPCGNIKKWESISTKNNKTEAICDVCGRFVELPYAANINNVHVSGTLYFGR